MLKKDLTNYKSYNNILLAFVVVEC